MFVLFFLFATVAFPLFDVWSRFARELRWAICEGARLKRRMGNKLVMIGGASHTVDNSKFLLECCLLFSWDGLQCP